jgi:hypothetical protein
VCFISVRLMVVSETADHFFQVSYNPTLRTGRNVRANRVGAANALKNKKKNKRSSVLFSWFSNTQYTGT